MRKCENTFWSTCTYSSLCDRKVTASVIPRYISLYINYILAQARVLIGLCQFFLSKYFFPIFAKSGPANKKGCDNLLCVNCDLKIVSFDNYRWSYDTDYLFLRNNFPDFERLKSKLIQTGGCRAYACQCQHRSVNTILDVQSEQELKWSCMKHWMMRPLDMTIDTACLKIELATW